MFAFCFAAAFPPWIFSVVHWICGSSHELCKCNIIIANLIYKMFRGQGSKVKGSIVEKGLMRIGLLHAHENHLQENMEISRDSVTEHRICFVAHTNHMQSCVVFMSDEQQVHFTFTWTCTAWMIQWRFVV